jgi:hypothetical protein
MSDETKVNLRRFHRLESRVESELGLSSAACRHFEMLLYRIAQKLSVRGLKLNFSPLSFVLLHSFLIERKNL